jgi:antitoxin VapB
MNIKNAETERLARKLSKLTGESMTQAITLALQERLKRIEAQREDRIKAKVEAVMKIVRRAGAAPDIRSDSHNDLYGEDGLPK